MIFINLEHHPNDSRLKIAPDDICQTLSQRMGTGGNNVPLVLAIAEEAYGGGMYCSDSNDVFPTLRTQMKHHEPILVLENTDDSNAEKILRCEDKRYRNKPNT